MGEKLPPLTADERATAVAFSRFVGERLDELNDKIANLEHERKQLLAAEKLIGDFYYNRRAALRERPND
jgi:hypothetical protein